MKADDIRRRIEEGIAGSVAEVRDLTGTGDHFEAAVTASAFDGRGLVERHQMVFGLFKPELATGELHAFTLKTKAPVEG